MSFSLKPQPLSRFPPDAVSSAKQVSPADELKFEGVLKVCHFLTFNSLTPLHVLSTFRWFEQASYAALIKAILNVASAVFVLMVCLVNKYICKLDRRVVSSFLSVTFRKRVHTIVILDYCAVNMSNMIVYVCN